MNEFFRVESPTQIISFRLSEIVAIESPNWPNRPPNWAEGVAAAVYLRNRTDCICLNAEQWAQLKDKLGALSAPKGKSSQFVYT